MQTLELTMPDDWHVHFREGDVLADTVKATADAFGRALLMPNLKTPLVTPEQIKAYRAQVQKHAPSHFQPYFSLYLTDNMSADTLEKAKQHPFIVGAKLYPQGATTNAAHGVSSIKPLYPLFEVMSDLGLVLQVHGETTSGDIFYREKRFLTEHLAAIHKHFPRLRIVLEHISTKAAYEFVLASDETVAATVTIHHLLYNRNHLLAGGIKPHFYCLPILKTESDQLALQQAALSGSPKFFLGTDSAPHAIDAKQSACGCAGIYSAPYAMPLYIAFFEQHQQLSKLEPFASFFGADFYRLPRNTAKVTYIKQPQTVPNALCLGSQQVRPIAANETLAWSQPQ